MANPMTEPLEPYQPDAASDLEWDEEHDAAYKPKVLWGRVVVLGGMLILAFLLGRATKGDGIPTSELNAAKEQIQTLEEENRSLEEELASAPVAPAETAPAETEPADPAEETTVVEGQTYFVKSGDTLTTIAQKFYGDPSLDDFLAEANGITDKASLSVGQELIIPDDPEA
jgi:nucleoid-associated protein YgaU